MQYTSQFQSLKQWKFPKFLLAALPILPNLPNLRKYRTLLVLNCELYKIYTTPYMNSSTIKTLDMGHICKHDPETDQSQ